MAAQTKGFRGAILHFLEDPARCGDESCYQ